MAAKRKARVKTERIRLVSKTDRIPVSSIFATLTPEQREMHEDIKADWNEVCTRHASLGRKLRKYHKSFERSGVVKRGGPGSKWGRYLADIGIPKTTAQDYMDLAKERAEAGISETAEMHLASVGIPLDKPKISDALITLKKEVRAIKTPKQAEALKSRILEEAQKPQETVRIEQEPLTPEERDLYAARISVRKAVNNVPNNRKLGLLRDAISEEAFEAWEMTEPFTLEIRPRKSALTLDGRKRTQEKVVA